MSGKAWVVGWLPTSNSKKFAIYFAVLLAIVIASGMIVARSLERLDGTGTQIDLSGSLRYLTRNIPTYPLFPAPKLQAENRTARCGGGLP